MFFVLFKCFTMTQKQNFSKGLAFFLERIKDYNKVAKIKYDCINNSQKSIFFETIEEKPKKFEMLFANGFSFEDLQERLIQNKNAEIYSAPLLYADGTTALKYLIDTNIAWTMHPVLKKFKASKIKEMVYVNSIEKMLLRILGQELPYYHECNNSNERIVGYVLKSISGANIEEKKSVGDYKILDEKWGLPYGGLTFVPIATGLARINRYTSLADTNTAITRDESPEFL